MFRPPQIVFSKQKRQKGENGQHFGGPVCFALSVFLETQ